MRNAYLLFLTLVCSAGVSAYATEFPWDSGNAFVRLCEDHPSEELSQFAVGHSIACIAYLHGLSDGQLLPQVEQKTRRLYCRDADIENQQQVRIVLKYIKDNPAKAHFPTPLLFLEAMKEAFPCSDKE